MTADELRANLETIKARLAAGETLTALAKEFKVNKGTMFRVLNPPKRETGDNKDPKRTVTTSANAGEQEGKLEAESSDVQESELKSDRQAARKLMRKALNGKVDLTAQQTALIRLLLKDELEPEAEKNPYAGIETEELGLRALTCAVSVLGLHRVSVILSTQAKAGTLDLGLNWEPDEAKQVSAPQLLPASQELAQSRLTDVMRQDGVETLDAGEAPKPAGIIAQVEQVSAGGTVDSEVEAL